MIIKIIVIVIFIGVFISSIWMCVRTKKRKSVLKEKIFILAIFGIGFIVANLLWTIPLITTRNYVEVDAVVTKVEEVDNSTPEHFDYDHAVTFKYTYNGVEYYGEKMYQTNEKIPSKATKIKFNPENPTEIAGNSLIWASIIVSIVFGIVDYFLVMDLINYMRNRNKKKEYI